MSAVWCAMTTKSVSFFRPLTGRTVCPAAFMYALDPAATGLSVSECSEHTIVRTTKRPSSLRCLSRSRLGKYFGGIPTVYAASIPEVDDPLFQDHSKRAHGLSEAPYNILLPSTSQLSRNTCNHVAFKKLRILRSARAS